MREIELIKKYNYDHKKAHDLLKEEFVKDLLKENNLVFTCSPTFPPTIIA